jgi:hypothetical protein
VDADLGGHAARLAAHLAQAALDLAQPRLDLVVLVGQRGLQRIERGLLRLEVGQRVGGQELLVGGVHHDQLVLEQAPLVGEIAGGRLGQDGAAEDQVLVDQPVQDHGRALRVGVLVADPHDRSVGGAAHPELLAEAFHRRGLDLLALGRRGGGELGREVGEDPGDPQALDDPPVQGGALQDLDLRLDDLVGGRDGAARRVPELGLVDVLLAEPHQNRGLGQVFLLHQEGGGPADGEQHEEDGDHQPPLAPEQGDEVGGRIARTRVPAPRRLVGAGVGRGGPGGVVVHATPRTLVQGPAFAPRRLTAG